MSGAPENLRAKLFQEIRVLDDRISAEEVELLEKKKEEEEMRELWSQRRRTKVEGWRDTDAEGEVTERAASGSQSSKAEVGHSNVPEAVASWKCTGRNQMSAGYVKAQPQKKRAVARTESAETQDNVTAPPVDESPWPEFEGSGRCELGGAGFHPKFGEGASLGSTHVRQEVQGEGLQVL